MVDLSCTLGSLHTENPQSQIFKDVFSWDIGNLKILVRKDGSLVLTGPITFRLFPSFGIVEAAYHEDTVNITLIETLPHIIKGGDRGLTENSKYFIID